MGLESHPARVPQQDRSRATRERLLDAGQRLFCNKGYFRTNSKEVAAEAGVATGSFYAYFPDKKQLFLAVLERYSGRIFAAMPAMPSEELLRGGTRELVHRYLRQVVQAHDLPELHRQLFVAVRNDPDFEALIERWEQEAVRRLERDLRALSGQLRISDLRTAAVLLQGTLQAMIQRTTVSRAAARQERLVRELADMFHRYLFAEEKPGRT